MSQIYYIFGPSSVGKTTLINNILKNKNVKIKKEIKYKSGI